MEVDYRFEQVSRFTGENLYTIGVRFDAQHSTDRDAQESWCVRMRPGTSYISGGDAAWYTDIWAAPSGEVFISDAGGRVYRNAGTEEEEPTWQHDDLGVHTLTGIWGLDVDHVLTWSGPGEALHRWDGRAWSAMPHPGGWIRAIRGTRADSLYAVGHDGLIARWDGRGWTRVPSPDTRLASVAVTDAGLVFAAGPGGELLQASENGLSKLLEHEASIHCIAWWNGALWVGADDGLWRLADKQLEIVKDNVAPHAMDARKHLLMAEHHRIVATADGAAFKGYPVTGFAKHCCQHSPMWAPTTIVSVDHGEFA